MFSLRSLVFCLIAGTVLAISTAGFASNKRLFVDPRANLAMLAESGEVVVFGSKSGRNFRADASAVIRGDFGRLARASADYNRYKEMGMPYLQASHAVGRPDTSILYVWNWMRLSLMGFTEETKHCFEVRFSRSMPGGAAGSHWGLHRCPPHAASFLPSNLVHHYEDAPAFERLNGSWYMHPIQRGNERLIYVRYFMDARPSNSLAGLVGGAIMNQFKRGAAQVIQILAREAASQP